VLSLGLSDITPFDPQKKIIEYRIAPAEKLLKDMTVAGFVDELSSESAAPGGGSVAALCGSLSAALSSMVANLTHGKKGYEKHNDAFNTIAEKAQSLKKFFVQSMDDDTKAFNNISAARRLPKGSDEERATRDAAIAEANLKATMVPLTVLASALTAVELAELAIEKGNPNTLSDAGVAALTARAAAEGAYYNVLINLPSLADDASKTDIRARADKAVAAVREKTQVLHEKVLAKLQNQ
jgi:glutamate formiminotransferase/formiminotetrahydrofolate cyclodeaminase